MWPEEYRGENWKPIYAILFAGKCQVCAYSCPLPRSRRLRDKWTGTTRLLQCTNHPASPGEIEEVLPTDTCRNFRPKPWKRRRANMPAKGMNPPGFRAGRKLPQIPLGNGLFATVDREDYPEISKYRWYATRRGHTIYATCLKNRKPIYMHRMVMRPRSGYIVDHIDRNGLNNCRDNLRVCTRRQNQANRGPCGGTSRFVGVYRHKDRWLAGFRWRGKYYYVGYFDDEVEAAKARDRKAYELQGEFAYLNFPEDFPPESRGRKVTAGRAASSGWCHPSS